VYRTNNWKGGVFWEVPSKVFSFLSSSETKIFSKNLIGGEI